MSTANCGHTFSAHFALPHVDDKNNHMKRPLLVIIIWFLLSAFGFAQDEKPEVGVFAGGYFNSGFQSFKILNPTTGAQVGTFKPVSEANSGIFGARGSYDFRSQMAAEVTFGSSPAGRSQNSFAFGQPIVPVLVASEQAIPVVVRSPCCGMGMCICTAAHY